MDIYQPFGLIDFFFWYPPFWEKVRYFPGEGFGMKKFRFNGKDNLILRVFITILGLLLISNISLANTARIEVKVIVPAMQRLVIKDPVALSFTYPWEGMESGQALIFKM